MTVQTTRGEIDERLLSKKESAEGRVLVVEYYLNNELVHRSVYVRLTGVQVAGVAEITH